MSFQQYGIKTIKSFLGDKYHIPNYQREYAWEENELLDFWNDLENLRTGDQTQQHFFGQVVIHNNEDDGNKYIIDGQQRTITSMIFMRVLQYNLKDIINKTEDATIKAEAEDDDAEITYNYKGKFSANKNELHLTLDELNADYFRDNILIKFPNDKKNPQIETRKSQEKMRYAFWFLNKKIQEVQSSTRGIFFELIDTYYKLFTEQFVVLYMEATKLEEAFIIFETLNARGKDLETADLLKNYIFSKSSDNFSSVEKNWKKMISVLENNDPTKYIRYYWNSKYNHTSEKSLYKEITRKIVNPRDCNDLLNKLVQYAPLYHDLVNPDECSYFKSESVKKNLQILKDLKASTFYPVIISMKNSEIEYTEDDIAKVLEKIISLIFRNITICDKVAKTYEISFSKIAKAIFDSSINSVDKICATISDDIVSNDEFSALFNMWTGSESSSNKKIIRYILRTIYASNPDNQEICTNNNLVHIEHIMPIDNSKWTEISQEDHDKYLWKLGNLTLLGEKNNIPASNDNFETKKKFYNASKIEENIKIAKNNNWTIKEIEYRQNELCKLALRIWEK